MNLVLGGDCLRQLFVDLQTGLIGSTHWQILCLCGGLACCVGIFLALHVVRLLRVGLVRMFAAAEAPPGRAQFSRVV